LGGAQLLRPRPGPRREGDGGGAEHSLPAAAVELERPLSAVETHQRGEDGHQHVGRLPAVSHLIGDRRGLRPWSRHAPLPSPAPESDICSPRVGVLSPSPPLPPGVNPLQTLKQAHPRALLGPPPPRSSTAGRPLSVASRLIHPLCGQPPHPPMAPGGAVVPLTAALALHPPLTPRGVTVAPTQPFVQRRRGGAAPGPQTPPSEPRQLPAAAAVRAVPPPPCRH